LEVQAPENSVRRDALSWFPEQATLVMSVHLRQGDVPATIGSYSYLKVFREMFKQMPEEKETYYSWFEKVGNIRYERFAVAVVETGQDKMKVYIRVTGKFDHERLINTSRQDALGAPQIKKEKEIQGKKLTLIKPRVGLATAVIGNEEQLQVIEFPLTLEFDLFPRNEENWENLLNEILDVSRGKKDGVLQGSLAVHLKKISPRASGMLVGTVPDSMLKEMQQAPGAFHIFPKEILIELTSRPARLEVRWQGQLDN